MARPVKWSRDLHPIRDRAQHSRTETWSRQDIERLFSIGRASAQSLMKAIGDVQTVGGSHFIDRASLLSFLDAIIAAPSVEEGLRNRRLEAEPPPRPKSLRVSFPADLRSAMIPDLPANIELTLGQLVIKAPTAVAMLESLWTLALIMQNYLDRFQAAIEPQSRPPEVQDDDLREVFNRLRLDIPTG